MLSTLFASLTEMLPTVQADEDKQVGQKDGGEGEEGEKEESGGGDDAAEEEEEEEEEEPEDTAPGIRDKCAESKACKAAQHHFEECQERVQAGNTKLHGETCVEEFFHFLHCVDDCAAPKVFATLK